MKIVATIGTTFVVKEGNSMFAVSPDTAHDVLLLSSNEDEWMEEAVEYAHTHAGDRHISQMPENVRHKLLGISARLIKRLALASESTPEELVLRRKIREEESIESFEDIQF